jgi:hypothetical protein
MQKKRHQQANGKPLKLQRQTDRASGNPTLPSREQDESLEDDLMKSDDLEKPKNNQKKRKTKRV